jgi:hypothetical protein
MARGKGEGSITEDKRRGTWTAEIKLTGVR